MPSTALTKLNFISGNLGILTQPTVPGLIKDHFTRLQKQTDINSPIFAYFILFSVFTMCKPNLIGILPIPGAKKVSILKQIHNRQTH